MREAEAAVLGAGVLVGGLFGCGLAFETSFVSGQEEVHPLLDFPLFDGWDVRAHESLFEDFVYAGVADVAGVQVAEAFELSQEHVGCHQLLGRMSAF